MKETMRHADFLHSKMLPLGKILFILFERYFIPKLFKCKCFVLFIVIHKTMPFKEDLVLTIFLKCGNVIVRFIR